MAIKPPTRASKDPKLPPATKMPPKQGGDKRPKKTFAVKDWDGSGDGEKAIIYAESGMGKSTLGSTSPEPVFIGLDDGGRKLVNPITGDRLKFVEGVETLYDFRDALHSYSIFDNYKTIVIDTVTILQERAEPLIFDKYLLPKGGTAASLRDYGWGDGFGHLVEVMRLILQDCDYYIKKGKNIVMLAQLSSPRKANAGGTDFRLFRG